MVTLAISYQHCGLVSVMWSSESSLQGVLGLITVGKGNTDLRKVPHLTKFPQAKRDAIDFLVEPRSGRQPPALLLQVTPSRRQRPYLSAVSKRPCQGHSIFPASPQMPPRWRRPAEQS